MGIAWPSEDIASDCKKIFLLNINWFRSSNLIFRFIAIAISSPLLLTARLSPGQQVKIISLAGLGANNNSKQGVSAPRDAAIIRVKEKHSASVGSRKDEQRDWLDLLLRESFGIPSPILFKRYEIHILP